MVGPAMRSSPHDPTSKRMLWSSGSTTKRWQPTATPILVGCVSGVIDELAEQQTEASLGPYLNAS